MTRLLCASSAASVAMLAAALDLLDPAGRTVLVLSSEAPTPEVADPVAAGPLRDRVAEVVSWSALIAPLHPAHWQPPATELPLLRRLFTPVFGPEPVSELVVESVTDGAGRALAALLPDAAITLVSHDLATYGPPLRHAPSDVTERVERLLYLDVLPGLPVRLAPRPDVVVTPVPAGAYLAHLSAPDTDVDVVLLGTRLAERGLLTAAEQQQLHADAVRALAASGAARIGFAPHPAAEPASDESLRRAVAESGAALTVYPAGTPHDARVGSSLAGWGEAALLLADRAVTFDATALLDRQGPYDRPDRMALTLVNAAVPHVGSPAPDPVDLPLLADAVSFCLTPAAVPDLADRAAAWVAAHGAAPYLRKKRLGEWGVGGSSDAAASSRRATWRGRLRGR